jgi:hypothetical protein
MSISSIGNHVGEVIATGLKKASTGNVQVLIQFRDEEGNTITAYLATTDKAWEWTEKKLIACGWVPADNDYDLTKLNDIDCPVIGMKEIPFSVVEDTYEGKTNHKVDFIGEGGVGINERMSGDEVKIFAAQLRTRLHAKGGQKTAPKPAAKPAAKKGSPAPWDR